MKKYLLLSILLLMTTILHGQMRLSTSLPSDFLMQSGLVLGTERERQFSMRMEALGRDLSGIMADQITDLYRNPAFFGDMKTSLIFADVVRVTLPASSGSLSSRVRPTSGFETGGGTTTGLRLGYAKTFSVLVRGNYSSTPSRTSYNSQWIDTRVDERQLEDRQDWGEAQVAYGFSLGKNLKAGISYTYGTSEVLDALESFTTQIASRLSLSWYDSTYYTSQNFRESTTTTNSHIGRFGLLSRAADGASWDAVATVEFLTADVRGNTQEQYYRYNLDRLLDASRQSIYQDDRQNASSQRASINAVNMRLDAQVVKVCSPTRTFVAQLGLGIASLSSSDRVTSSETSNEFRQTTIDTSQFDRLSSSDVEAAPDGFGFQIRGSVGWNIHADRFSIVPALLAHFQRLSYDYVNRREIAERQSISLPDTAIVLNDIESSQTVSNKHEVLFYRIAVPFGIEYRMSDKVDLRAGAVVELFGSINEKQSTENGFRLASHRLDFSTIQVGAGLKISEQLRAEVVTRSDIGQPYNWNVSAILNF